jgi:hypothetical protein
MKRQTFLWVVLALVVAGCGPKKGPIAPTPTPVSEGQTETVINAVQLDVPQSTPKDAQPTIPMAFQLACYQISVPVGKVSRNEAFWKRIDEQVLDPARYDLLQRNGMRLGIAPLSEFANIRSILDETSSPAKAMGTIGPGAKNIEISMRPGIPFETISYYADGNGMASRTFDRCENVFNISYRRAPRSLADMRLDITPMVRSTVSHLEYTEENNAVEIRDVMPTSLYMNLEVDLPMDKFLVVAPSDSALLPTVIGHQFFVKNDPSQQMEQVLIFVAQPFRMDEPPKEGK